ncbi:MAG: response regulator [bacterium]|nr:response regulator [bacterium]
MDRYSTDQPRKDGFKLLVVDDDAIIRERLKELAESLGFIVKIAKDGADGWQVFQRLKPNLAIIDIYLPCINGLQLMRMVKEADPQCLVLLITGFLKYEQVVQHGYLPGDAFLRKPFTLEDVKGEICKLMDSRESILADTPKNELAPWLR